MDGRGRMWVFVIGCRNSGLGMSFFSWFGGVEWVESWEGKDGR